MAPLRQLADLPVRIAMALEDERAALVGLEPAQGTNSVARVLPALDTFVRRERAAGERLPELSAQQPFALAPHGECLSPGHHVHPAGEPARWMWRCLREEDQG